MSPGVAKIKLGNYDNILIQSSKCTSKYVLISISYGERAPCGKFKVLSTKRM